MYVYLFYLCSWWPKANDVCLCLFFFSTSWDNQPCLTKVLAVMCGRSGCLCLLPVRSSLAKVCIQQPRVNGHRRSRPSKLVRATIHRKVRNDWMVKKLARLSVSVVTIPGKVQHQKRYAYSVLLILSYVSHDGWLASSIFSHDLQTLFCRFWIIISSG